MKDILNKLKEDAKYMESMNSIEEGLDLINKYYVYFLTKNDFKDDKNSRIAFANELCKYVVNNSYMNLLNKNSADNANMNKEDLEATIKIIKFFRSIISDLMVLAYYETTSFKFFVRKYNFVYNLINIYIHSNYDFIDAFIGIDKDKKY